jgi:hypothetical protein
MRKAVEALLCVGAIAVAWASPMTHAGAQPANSSTAAPAVQPQGGGNAALRSHVPWLTAARMKRERAQAVGQQRWQQFRKHPEWAKIRRSRQFREHPEWAKMRRSRQFRQHPEWAMQRSWWLRHQQHSKGKVHRKGRKTYGR